MADVGKIVVLADFVFTASAVVVQPISGLGLIHLQGWSLTSPWLMAAYGLYVLIGLCWLPVVWIQYRMMRLAEQAAGQGAALPSAYHRLFRWWFALGWPALRRSPGHLLADGRQAGFLSAKPGVIQSEPTRRVRRAIGRS